MRKILPLFMSILPLVAPLIVNAQAYQYQRAGIFDCNQNGAFAMSVGSLGATGGVYVPVADATVELNTGVLVYKECVLREIVVRERESAMAAYTRRTALAVQTARNGNPLYAVKPALEMVTVASDPVALATIQDAGQQVHPAFRSNVQRAFAQTYGGQTRSPQNILACPIQSDLNALETAQAGTFNFNDFYKESNPACYALGAAGLVQNLGDAAIGAANGDLYTQWLWGRGYYPVVDSNGNVVTPAVNVQESFQTILDSPIHQLESANDIGQMIGALYAGLDTQIIADNQGLAGLTQPTGGQPSYLDQVAQQSGEGLRNAADNAAVQTLNAAKQIENAYFQAVNAIGTTLVQTIAQLRGAENQCWGLIIQKVCTASASATSTGQGAICSDTDGNSYKIATSTAFSQPIIDSQITPLASSTISQINASQQALSAINQLIQLVASGNPSAQQSALQQLDQLVSQHVLHTQFDVQSVVLQQQKIQDAVSTLVTNTVQAWADSTDPNVGWCNVNNQAVVDGWKAKWKQ